MILYEEDFDEGDARMIHMLEKMYPLSLMENSCVFKINGFTFLFSREDAAGLTEQHLDVLSDIADEGELHNPVYVSIDEEGRMDID